MKNVLAIVAMAGLTGVAGADTVANWGFNDQGLPAGGFGWETTDFPQAADVGSGMFSIANFNNSDTAGVYDWVQSFSGTTTGSIDGVSGGSFSFQGATTQGVTNNGAQAWFSFDGTAWTDLMIDFARRGTSTGFNNVTVEMYADGSSVGVLDTLGAATSTWVASNYDISALNGVADAAIVFTFDGASSDTGNNRLDNVTITGNAIPTPGTAALLGLGGLVAARRRRA
jgi:MYXO-CTERM domain-containing protein